MAALRDTSDYYHLVLERIVPKSHPAFEDAEEQERVWGRRWGACDDIGALRMVMVHRPGAEVQRMSEDHYDPAIDALIDDDEQWYFRSDKAPDLDRMRKEHDGLVKALQASGAEVVFVEGSELDPKSTFTRDCGIAVKGGIIICRMGPVGKAKGTGRRGEVAYVSKKVSELGMPILGTVHGTGLTEGGSFCFLDRKHAIIGMSPRQNSEGVRQIRELLAYQGVEVLEMALTGHSLHIDGAIVMIDHDKALVNVSRVAYWLLDTLKSLGIKAIFTDSRDKGMVVNCLAVSPGKIIISDCAKYTCDALDKLGVQVTPLPYGEIEKNGGSIRCSTMPLIRDWE